MVKTVGVVSPGDMGHSVGATLREGGLRLVTCLADRSGRTRALAEEAGIEDLPDYEALVGQADVILSILVPARATDAATRVAEAMEATGAAPVYADCNAIAPQTTRAIGERITVAGGLFVDASIIGPPPRGGAAPRLYACGPGLERFCELAAHGLDIRPLGPAIGAASAVKMCYAALTKGSTALWTQLLTAARALDILGPLMDEFQASQGATLERMRRGVPSMPTKSRRWVGEMEEIARTFAAVGLSALTFQGIAETYRLVGSTTLADRTPEDAGAAPDLETTLAVLARAAASEGGA